MTSKGKGIYKTFKRSISSSINTVGDAFGQSSSSTTSGGGAKYGGGSGKTWIHPPDVLLNGRVEYSVKLLGQREVEKAKGTDTIRDAITAIRFQLQVKRSETGHSGAKLQKVDLQINIEGLTVVDSKTKMVLHRYPLQRISFCADDKQDKRVFSFIAKADSDPTRHDCFVFLSDKMAEQITLTVGEAFDLAYKRYMDRNKTSLENRKQELFLRKRIAELEAENQVLSQRLAESIRGNTRPSQPPSLLDTPTLPSTPMPRAPPPGMTPTGTAATPNSYVNTHPLYSTPQPQQQPPPSSLADHPFADLVSAPSQFAPTINTNTAPVLQSNGNQNGHAPSSSSSSPSGPAPSHPPPPCPVLAPPPPVAPRRNPPVKPAPEVGRRLENLQLDKMEDVFDDSFDPRADDKKKKDCDKEYDPFGDDFLDEVVAAGDAAGRNAATRAADSQPTADDFQAMIDKVDRKLAEMSTGFSGGELETGQVSPGGDSFQDLEESDYGTPSDRVNPEAVAGSAAGGASSTSASSKNTEKK